MPRVSITDLGIKAYLDRVYGQYGGWDRFDYMAQNNWPNQAIGDEFGGTSRQTVSHWKEERVKLKEKAGQA